MPTARTFPAGAVLNGQLYVITGIVDSDPPLQTVEVYNPATDEWRAETPIPTGRDHLGEAGVIDGKLYVAGGWNPCFGCDIATLEVFKPEEAEGAVGGSVTGLRPALIVCENLSTSQVVVIWEQAPSWNCETAGLEVTPGEIIRITLVGGAN
jgi:Kelch motif